MLKVVLFRGDSSGRRRPFLIVLLFLVHAVAVGQSQSFEAAFGDLLAAPPPAPPVVETSESKYYQSVLDSAKACIDAKASSPSVCFVSATPKKCESLAYSLPSSRKQWAICVRSCADAGVWSSFLGECRRRR